MRFGPQHRRRGFSLIELMMVVGIIAILASLAIPTYTYYQLKSRQTEGKMVLAGVRISQETFLGEHDNYANVTTPNPTAAPGPVPTQWEAQVCPNTCGRQVPEDCITFECLGFTPIGLIRFQYVAPHRKAVGSLTAEYGSGAVADLDTDGTPGSWAYRSANDPINPGIGIVADGLSACPAGIPAEELWLCTPVDF